MRVPVVLLPNAGRSPHGERGLKSVKFAATAKSGESLSSRRAWIEMRAVERHCLRYHGRSPHGERGLK